MNGKIAAVALTSLSLAALNAQAIPTAGELSGQYYLVEATDLNSWHVGLYGRGHERKLKDDGRKIELEVNRGLAFAGYDVFSWFTLYGLAGVSEMKLSHGNWSSDKAGEFGLGAWLNLLDHDAMDFNELCDRFRIQAALQYSVISNDHVDYGEFSANLTFGIVNEIRGSKEFWPENIALYAGPCLNIVHCDDYDQERDDELGMVFGLDVQLSRRVSFGGSIEVYQDDRAYGGTVSVRF
jgi:hypothetical protein